MPWYNDGTFTPDTVRTARRVRLAAPAPTSDLYHGPDRTLYVRGSDGVVARVAGADVRYAPRPDGAWTRRTPSGWGKVGL